MGRRYRDLESKKSKKPIPWSGKNASDGDSLTTYTLDIQVHWLENEARKTKGFKKLNSINKGSFVVAGGVAANKGIRKKLIEVSLQYNFKPIFPDLKLCGDNAAMIAMVGLEKFKNKQFDNLDLPAEPRLPLDINAKFLKGAGVEL